MNELLSDNELDYLDDLLKEAKNEVFVITYKHIQESDWKRQKHSTMQTAIAVANLLITKNYDIYSIKTEVEFE